MFQSGFAERAPSSASTFKFQPSQLPPAHKWLIRAHDGSRWKTWRANTRACMPRAHNCAQSRVYVRSLHLTEFRGSIPLITSQEGCLRHYTLVVNVYVCMQLTFFKRPSLVPRKATVWRSTVAMVTEVRDVSGNWITAWFTIGVLPEIFSPTSQKFNMLPVDWNRKINSWVKKRIHTWDWARDLGVWEEPRRESNGLSEKRVGWKRQNRIFLFPSFSLAERFDSSLCARTQISFPGK